MTEEEFDNQTRDGERNERLKAMERAIYCLQQNQKQLIRTVENMERLVMVLNEEALSNKRKSYDERRVRSTEN